MFPSSSRLKIASVSAILPKTEKECDVLEGNAGVVDPHPYLEHPPERRSLLQATVNVNMCLSF